MKWLKALHAVARGDFGQDLVEYALLICLITIVCYVAVEAAGSAMFTTFDVVAAQMNALPIAGGS